MGANYSSKLGVILVPWQTYSSCCGGLCFAAFMKLSDSTTSAGDIYDSDLLSGYPSRALREDEFHARVRKTTLSHPFEISYANIPARVETPGEPDAIKIKSWPLILPSSIDFWLQIKFMS